MKHAYLIIAHSEYEILECLINCLDDERNDIFIHIDKKATFNGENLKVQKSSLYILPERLDVRWGDYSMVEVELMLFSKAYSCGPYSYYHLLSGVDLPLKSQDYIHEFCRLHQGKEFVGIAQNVSQKELDWRSQHWFVFSRDFQSKNLFKRFIRAIFSRLQSVFHYRRTTLQIKKGAQWCSITHELVGYLLVNRKLIRDTFNHTYCPDELFIQTLSWNSKFRSCIYNIDNEFEGCKRYIKWENSVLLPLCMNDIDMMIQSTKWFARKFTSENISVVRNILKYVQ